MRALSAWAAVATVGIFSSTPGTAQVMAAGNPVSLGVVVSATGLCSADLQPAPGALIGMVRPGGAADRAGLKPGDVILRFGSTQIQVWTDLPRAVQLAHAGDQIAIVVKHGDALVTDQVQFTQTDSGAPSTGQSSAPPVASNASAPPFAPSCSPRSYSVLPLPTDAAQRAAALVGDSSVSLEGDVLTIAHRDPGDAVQLIGPLQLPMTHIPGTQVWLTQLKMDGWERMFFSYQFIGSQHTPAVQAIDTFHGAKAPVPPLMAPQLQGRLIHTHVHSRLLGADRDISVYLPPGAAGKLPVLYMTDGQSVESFARVLEPLILSHRTRPFALIGEHSGQDPGVSAGHEPQPDMRTREYVPGVDKKTFDRHLRFFTEELLPWASVTYGVSARRTERALFGFSNGADFGLEMAVVHPELFGAVLPFSAGMLMLEPVPKKGLPHMYLAAGELESSFAVVTHQAQGLLREAGAEAVFTLYPSGHDILMWQLALVNYAPNVFPSATDVL
jgi:enterochelin esterase-like enzyme